MGALSRSNKVDHKEILTLQNYKHAKSFSHGHPTPLTLWEIVCSQQSETFVSSLSISLSPLELYLWQILVPTSVQDCTSVVHLNHKTRGGHHIQKLTGLNGNETWADVGDGSEGLWKSKCATERSIGFVSVSISMKLLCDQDVKRWSA